MKLVPINDNTQTKLFTLEQDKHKQKEIKKVYTEDPFKVIPSGMYAIISTHRRNLFVSIVAMSLIFTISLMMILAFALFLDTNWFAFIFPITISIVIAYKWVMSMLEYNSFNKLIYRYREDIQYDLTSIPQFLDTIYVNLIKKQVTHNWVSFISLFYLSIFTVLLWWLKDQSWWIFKFDAWSVYIFKDPTWITYLLTLTILLILFIHIYLTIARKKQLYRIDAFTGKKIISGYEITQMKSTLNKGWRRGFILSLIIILVIPIIIKLILKLIVKR